jgi:hypothetical protein
MIGHGNIQFKGGSLGQSDAHVFVIPQRLTAFSPAAYQIGETVLCLGQE